MYKVKKILTGIKGFDEILYGGINKGHMILLSGVPGSGKTILGLQYLYLGAMKGKKGLFISFEESLDSIKETAKCFGWNLNPLIKKGLIKIININATAISKDLFLASSGLVTEFRSFNPDRLVIDSISTVEMIVDPMPEIKQSLYDFIKFFKNGKCTTILISEMNKTTESTLLSAFGVEEYMMDGVVYLSLILSESGYNRLLFISKMRRTKFIEGGHNFIINNNGIKIYPRKISIW